MSAVSKMLTPASRQRPMRRLASSTPVDPQALKNSVPPPKVPVPKHSAETLSPESPSSLYSIEYLLSLYARPLALIFGRMSRAEIISLAGAELFGHSVHSRTVVLLKR